MLDHDACPVRDGRPLTTPASGIEDTGGETGTISCTGTFGGARVTGDGSFGYRGVFTRITCVSDGMPLDGTYSMTIPTDAGLMHFTGAISDVRLTSLDRFTLTQPGATFVSTVALIVPTVGNCVTPVTEILIFMVGPFTG